MLKILYSEKNGLNVGIKAFWYTKHKIFLNCHIYLNLLILGLNFLGKISGVLGMLGGPSAGIGGAGGGILGLGEAGLDGGGDSRFGGGGERRLGGGRGLGFTKGLSGLKLCARSTSFLKIIIIFIYTYMYRVVQKKVYDVI